MIWLIEDDMRDWCLSKVIWVADRGFTSATNRRYLRTARRWLASRSLPNVYDVAAS